MTPTPPATLSIDRAAGVLLGLASGDALGAGYEFGPPLPDETPVGMIGGGGFGWVPGEWTDDTAMAVPIAQAAARGADLREEAVLDEIVAAWIDWARTAADVGVQTRAVLAEAARAGGTAAAARDAARSLHERTGKSAGNGSLMRTAPVALAHLHDPDAAAEAARALSVLTHWDDDAGDSCVLWTLAIRHAVLTGELDARTGLDALPAARRDRWAALLDDAEQREPRDFEHNGWVVEALQGAWSSIHRATDAHAETPTPGAALVDGLERAVRGGRDTDTVAAIAGGLLGAVHGASAVPSAWRLLVHGHPGLRAPDLVELAALAARGGQPDSSGWPTVDRMDYSSWGSTRALTPHPHDDGVLLGAVDDLDDAQLDGAQLDSVAVDAVVSLCRIGVAQRRPADHVEVWLIDDAKPELNRNLDLVLRDAADAVAAFRAQGKTVLLHCVQAQSRTPSVAALYAALHRGVPVERAMAEVVAALPAARPQPFLIDAVRRIAAGA
ncbi:MAG: ADP-ribosylglycohydrolase family protein [Actinobacteria bacterium]|nr:ADP-ribosylglycohydrolase family protein [Actinomycetota bacterium]MBU1609603.1 ADP-ribosylglycohydrolase family protein [Actinomycetota bacterium]MBU2315438.1 ADP-ribosylglycohydrolase family protein [Actinomycetota bacterium]MBU2384708.1 ADP-ribosylglycohydrolase family protein [Actinomycetota bacterium]